MEKIEVLKKEQIDKMTTDGNLELLYSNKNLEIMHQLIHTNSIVWIDPAEGDNVVEFFYVLSGKIKVKNGLDEPIVESHGCFYVESLKSKVFLEVLEDTEVVYICNHIISEDIVDFQKELSDLLVQIDEKDHFTKEHSHRVLCNCKAIYELLKDRYEIDLDTLVIAAIFHDIGKCKLSDEFLKRRINITDDELKEYTRHAEYGAEILKPLYGKKVSDIVLYHHERLDGSGYYGKKGDELNIETRIVSCVDAFDDMTTYYDSFSSGAYAMPMTKKGAILSLLSKPYQFDINVVTILHRLYNEGKLM